jgi:hypothetical protein
MEREAVWQWLCAHVAYRVRNGDTSTGQRIGQGETTGKGIRAIIRTVGVHFNKGCHRRSLLVYHRRLVGPGPIEDQAMNQLSLWSRYTVKRIMLTTIRILLPAHAIGERPEHKRACVPPLLELLGFTVQ